MSATWEVAEWLDGPGLVEWLKDEHGLEEVSTWGGSAARALFRWRSGARANVYAADRLLTLMAIHISEIPERLWITERPNMPKLDAGQRDELLRRLKAGESVKRLAIEYRISPSTVRYHRDKGCTYNQARKAEGNDKRRSLSAA